MHADIMLPMEYGDYKAFKSWVAKGLWEEPYVFGVLDQTDQTLFRVRAALPGAAAAAAPASAGDDEL